MGMNNKLNAREIYQNKLKRELPHNRQHQLQCGDQNSRRNTEKTIREI